MAQFTLAPVYRASRQNGVLSCNGKGLTAIPQEMLYPQDHLTDGERAYLLVALTRVLLDDNEIEAWPDDLNADQLSTDVAMWKQRNNKLSSLNDNFFSLTSLAVMDLSGNALTGTLNPAVGKLVRLASLNLARNGLTALPEEIGQVSGGLVCRGRPAAPAAHCLPPPPAAPAAHRLPPPTSASPWPTSTCRATSCALSRTASLASRRCACCWPSSTG